MESIWSAAWASAQAKTYGRTELLSAERDAALKSSTTRAAEIEALNADVDGLREKITLAEEHAAALAAKAQAVAARSMNNSRSLYVAGIEDYDELRRFLVKAVEAGVTGKRDIKQALDEAVVIWDRKLLRHIK